MLKFRQIFVLCIALQALDVCEGFTVGFFRPVRHLPELTRAPGHHSRCCLSMRPPSRLDSPNRASPVACKIHPPREIDGRPLFTDASSGFNPAVRPMTCICLTSCIPQKASEFIKTYWQKYPVLLRNAFRFESPVSPDELAGLACEKEIFSRIVIEWGALKDKGAPPDKPSWEMLMGEKTHGDTFRISF